MASLSAFGAQARASSSALHTASGAAQHPAPEVFQLQQPLQPAVDQATYGQMGNEDAPTSLTGLLHGDLDQDLDLQLPSQQFQQYNVPQDDSSAWFSAGQQHQQQPQQPQQLQLQQQHQQQPQQPQQLQLQQQHQQQPHQELPAAQIMQLLNEIMSSRVGKGRFSSDAGRLLARGRLSSGPGAAVGRMLVSRQSPAAGFSPNCRSSDGRSRLRFRSDDGQMTANLFPGILRHTFACNDIQTIFKSSAIHCFTISC